MFMEKEAKFHRHIYQSLMLVGMQEGTYKTKGKVLRIPGHLRQNRQFLNQLEVKMAV